MSGWGGGYIVDIPYMTGWYRQQSPALLALAAILGGVEATVPQGDDPIHFLELGCGQGFGALLLAASNPSWRVTAIDFNPAHIAEARSWAAEADLPNVTFIEADLAVFAGEAAAAAIPEADFVSLHGVWSWVAPAVKAGILRLLRDKVRPGGLVHVSYNALPSWGPRLGMQKLLRAAGRQMGSRSDHRAEEGVKVLKALHASGAIHLTQPVSTGRLLERLDQLPVSYLAHEFMNENWAPCFMTDVAEAMSGAKLEWAGSSHLVQNFPALTLTEAQQAIQRQFDDPLMRELVKDVCVDTALRHDVYVRGARRISASERDALLRETSISLNISPEHLPLEAETPVGKVELNPKFYQPLVSALRDGPRRIADLLALPDIEGRRDNPAELVGILVGLDMAEPAARRAADPGSAAKRLNRVTTRRFLKHGNLNMGIGAASHRLGTPMPATLLDLIVGERVLAGDTDPARIADAIGVIDEQAAALRAVVHQTLEVRVPVLRSAGVI